MLSFPKIRFKSAIPFASLILINLFLITLPLTNSLGYEFAFVNSIILFFVIGIFTCNKLKLEKELSLFRFAQSFYKTLLPLFLIPLIIGSLSSFFNSRCPIKDGFAFYLLMAFTSSILGILLAFISDLASKKYNRLIFISLTVLILLVSLIEFYFFPQVYLYNPFVGFFPGTIYDEDIAVNIKMILFQLYNLSVFGAGLFFIQKQKKRLITFVILILVFATSFLPKPLLGFTTTETLLQSELKTKISTEHFEIFLGDSINSSEYNFIGLLHEYYYEQITQSLKIFETPKISSYIFNDKLQKRELFGAGNANVSKPWMNSIFLNYTNYSSALKHEIVHAVAAKFGVTPFKVADNLNTAMIEGLAMFIENDFDGYPLNYAAKLAYNNGYKVNLEDLFNSGKFFTSYSSLAYIYSGAFLEFIASKFGINKVKELYGDLDFEEVVGESFNSLSKQFEAQLSESSFANKKHQAQIYFGGQTIFKKFCPRMASNDMKDAQSKFIAKEYNSAEEKYLAVYKYSSSANALNGYAASLKKETKYKQAITVLEKEKNNFSKSQSFYNLNLLLADCYMLSGDTMKAAFNYEQLEKENPHRNFVDWINLLNLIRRIEGADSLKKFLVADETERRNILFKLYEKSRNVFIVPYLLTSEKEFLPKITEIINESMKNFRFSDTASRKVAVVISQFLLKSNDYQNAKYFAVRAVDNYTDNYSRFSLVENLRMTNWFVNFASETKLKVESPK